MDADAVIVTFANVLPEAREVLNTWFDETRARQLAVEREAVMTARYDALLGELAWLALSVVPLHSEELDRGAVASPAWGSLFSSLHGFHERVYRRVFSMGDVSRFPTVPPVLLVTRADIVAGNEAGFDDWYNNVHLPEVLACPGFVSASRYECVNGEPRYLSLYDLDREDALETPEMSRAYGWGPAEAYVRNYSGGLYRLGASLPS